MKEFDEYDAVAYIRNSHPTLNAYDDDEILLAIDTAYDYFDSLPDDATDQQCSSEAVIDYVTKQLARDKESTLGQQPELVKDAINGLLDYEDTLGDILDDDDDN